CDVAELRPRISVRVGRRQRSLAKGEHDQGRVHVGLEAEIAMDILSQLASAADEARHRVEANLRPGSGAALTGQPVRVVREEALSPCRYRVALCDLRERVGPVEPQELTEVRADQVARRLTAERHRWYGFPVPAGRERLVEGIEVLDGSGDQRVGLVPSEGHVTRQREPV